MDTITQNRRYLPHTLITKVKSVEGYRAGNSVEFICRKYHISKASLMRWNKKYDGTKESLQDKSHRPHKPHPNSHTELELKMISALHTRNPKISVNEMYGKLKRKGYTRHPGSLYRVFVRLGYRNQTESTKEKKHNKKYDTPKELGRKWQIDVKFVPGKCYVGADGDKYYQYTAIDEATRERFIFPYKEHSGFSACSFLKKAILYFGYAPDIVQTDNGSEFTNWRDSENIHAFDVLCNKCKIEHKLIKPRTPEHNGKVERSHRNDQERFYNHLSFYNYDDLIVQMAAYLKRSNDIPSKVLNWESPMEMREQLMPISNPRIAYKKKKQLIIKMRKEAEPCAT